MKQFQFIRVHRSCIWHTGSIIILLVRLKVKNLLKVWQNSVLKWKFVRIVNAVSSHRESRRQSLNVSYFNHCNALLQTHGDGQWRCQMWIVVPPICSLFWTGVFMVGLFSIWYTKKLLSVTLQYIELYPTKRKSKNMWDNISTFWFFRTWSLVKVKFWIACISQNSPLLIFQQILVSSA